MLKYKYTYLKTHDSGILSISFKISFLSDFYGYFLTISIFKFFKFFIQMLYMIFFIIHSNYFT